MKVLLDECVPWPMHRLLSGHECTTAQREGWGGMSNGDLLNAAEDRFDLFITSDQNIKYQQHRSGRRIAILVLSTNDLRRIQAASAQIIIAVDSIRTSEFRVLAIS